MSLLRGRLPDLRQAEAAECGLACLAMVAAYHGKRMDLGTLRRRHPLSARGASLRSLIALAGDLGLAARPLRLEMEHLRRLRLPAILHWDLDHFVVLKRVGRRHIDTHDPALGPRRLSHAEASRHVTGVALELEPDARFRRGTERRRLSMREILAWPRGSRRAILQALLLSAVLQLHLIASPFYMQLAVDHAAAHDDAGLMLVLAVGFGLFLTVNVAADLLRTLALVSLQTGLAYGLSAGVLRHMLRLPLAWFEKRRVGDVLSRFGATEPIRGLLTDGVMSAAVDGVMAAVVAVLMVIYSPQLAAIVIPALLAYMTLRLGAYRVLRRRTLDAVQARARETGALVETLRAIQTVKVFNREGERCGLWTNCRMEVLNADAGLARLKAAFRAANDLVFGLENVLVIYIGILAVLDGRMSIGMLFAFTSYKTQFTDKVTRFIEQAIEFRMLELQLERLADIMTEAPERHLEDAAPAVWRPKLDGALEVRGLAYRHAEGEPFLFENVSFAVVPGEYVALTGPSGGGKTTLMKLMLGLLQPTAGEVLVDGMPLSRFGVCAFRDQVGVVMQDDQLLSGSVADNISFFDDAFEPDWMQRCAELAGVHAEVLRMPMGYNTLIGDMGSFLSGGQRQRLLLARALYRRPRILFLDEATSHLDVELEARVNAAVRALGLTRIIIAHRPETIASAGRVLSVGGGRVTDRRAPLAAAGV